MTDRSPQLAEDVLRERLTQAAADAAAGTAITDVRELGGGSSGLTYTAMLHGGGPARPVVVKLAPPGLEPVRNRDVLRQARLVGALGRDGRVPVPGVVFTDAGAPPEVPPLFVMEHVGGECFEPLIDAVDTLPAASDIAGRARHASAILATMHSLDTDALGLSAEHAVGLDEEISRWERMFAKSGIDLGDRPERTVAALRERMPAPLAPRLVHGDYRLGNQICAGGEVRAILDWEIWSVSDPRIDVGWFLMTFDADGLPSAVRRPEPGWPSSDEVLSVYEAAVGGPVDDLVWFSALARLRSAAAMSLNIKHNRRRATPSERIESYAALLPNYLDAALRRLEAS